MRRKLSILALAAGAICTLVTAHIQAQGTAKHETAGGISKAIAVMTTLNGSAAEAIIAADAHALTDITGFGLLGHLRNMTSASHIR